MLLHFLLVDFFLVLLISADQNRVVLNPFKDYRPSARRYIYIYKCKPHHGRVH